MARSRGILSGVKLERSLMKLRNVGENCRIEFVRGGCRSSRVLSGADSDPSLFFSFAENRDVKSNRYSLPPRASLDDGASNNDNNGRNGAR